MSNEDSIKIAAYKEVLRDLEYQKRNLSSEVNQEKTVQMSINRLKTKIKYLEENQR